MPINESVRLDLKVDGRDSVKGAASDVKDLGDSYALVERQVVQTRGQVVREFQRLQSQEQAFRGFIEAESDGVRRTSGRFDRLRDSVRGYGRGAEEAGKRTADLSRFLLHASQSSQDLMQGGFAAILNNLPQLAEGAAKSSKGIEKLSAAFGGPMGLAATTTFASLAIYALGPMLNGLWTAIAGGDERFPKTRDGLKAITAELKDNEKALDDLQAAWTGTSAELDRANQLLERNAELERKAEEERERRAKVKALRDKDAKSGLDERGGKAATEAIEKAGGVDKLVAQIAEQKGAESAVMEGASKALAKAAADKAAADDAVRKLESDPNALLARAMHNTSGTASDPYVVQKKAAAALSDAQAKLASARNQSVSRAEDLVTKAADGDQDAIKELDKRLPNAGLGRATKAGQDREDSLLRRFEAGNRRDAEILDAQKKAKSRNTRLKGYAEEIERAGKSTDEEMKQSEMMDFIDRNLKRLAPRMERLSNQQSLEASELALKYEAAGSSRPEAATAAFRDMRERDRKLREEAATAAGGGPAENRLSADADARRDDMQRRAAEVARHDYPLADPRTLQTLAREAADNAAGPDVGSIRQALQSAVWMAQTKMQADLNRQMKRLWVGGDSFIQ